jgi:hypothetical protein
VNYKKGAYNCSRCGGEAPEGRGSITKLAGLLGVTVESDDLDLSTEPVTVEKLDRDMVSIMLAGAGLVDLPPTTAERNEDPVQPPPGFQFISLENWYHPGIQRVVRYIYGRGMNVQHIQAYHLGVCPFKNYTQLVIPDFNHLGQLRWWQRRSLDDMPNPGPKYVGPVGDKAGKIGNWHQALVQRTPYIGVCEGAISAMAAGIEFTWLWGKEYSKEQVETLATASKPVVIALDGEAKAFGNTLGLANELRSQGVRPIIVPLPGDQDPASLGHAEFAKILAVALQHQDQSDLDYLERAVQEYV